MALLPTPGYPFRRLEKPSNIFNGFSPQTKDALGLFNSRAPSLLCSLRKQHGTVRSSSNTLPTPPPRTEDPATSLLRQSNPQPLSSLKSTCKAPPEASLSLALEKVPHSCLTDPRYPILPPSTLVDSFPPIIIAAHSMICERKGAASTAHRPPSKHSAGRAPRRKQTVHACRAPGRHALPTWTCAQSELARPSTLAFGACMSCFITIFCAQRS